MISELREYGVNVTVCDPVAEQGEAEHGYGFSLTDMDRTGKFGAVVLAVGHFSFMWRRSTRPPFLLHRVGNGGNHERNVAGGKPMY